jgi:hypothetical protein
VADHLVEVAHQSLPRGLEQLLWLLLRVGPEVTLEALTTVEALLLVLVVVGRRRVLLPRAVGGVRH